MEIRRIPPQTVPIANIVTATFTPGQTVALPVSPGELIYAHFRHISPVPAPPGSEGFSLDKLRMLENLIDRLVATKGGGAFVKSVEGLKPKEVDMLIARYQMSLHEATRSQPPAPYLPAAAAPGAILNLVA